MGGKAEVPHYNLHISQNDSQAILGLSNLQHERGPHEGFVPKVPVLKKPQRVTQAAQPSTVSLTECSDPRLARLQYKQ